MSTTVDTEKTLVIFRRHKAIGKQVFALFPLIPENDLNPEICMSYQHVGQHCSATYTHCIQNISTPADISEPDVKALFDELTSIGYNLTIGKRRPSNWREIIRNRPQYYIVNKG